MPELRAANVLAWVEFTARKTSVSFGTATLDVKTGRLTYPVDAIPEKLGLLRQLYAEAKYRAEVERQGGVVESRTVDKDGHVTLMCSMGEAPKPPRTRSKGGAYPAPTVACMWPVEWAFGGNPGKSRATDVFMERLVSSSIRAISRS